MGVQVLGDGFHQQVVMLRVNINDAGVHHNADAELGVPQDGVRVVHQKGAADDVDGGVDIVDLRGLLAAGELALDVSFREE